VSDKNSENDYQRIGAKLGRANAYNVAGQYKKAIELYSEAIKDVEQTFKSDDVSRLLWYKELAYALASLESTHGNFEEAKGYLSMNMELLEDLSKQYPELFMKDIANHRYLQAYCYFRLGEMKQARELVKHALVTFSTIPDKDSEKDEMKMNFAMAKRMLADIEYQMRNLETAKQIALEALDIAQKLYPNNVRKYRSLLIDCEKMAGSALRSIGDNAGAISHLQHVLELCKEQTADLPNQQAFRKIESNTLISLGWVYRGLNKQQEAFAAFKKALSILGTLDFANTDAANRQAEVNANYGCGQVLLYNNQVNDAMPYYQKAIKLASAIYQSHPSLIANDLHISLYALSSCYFQTNRLDQALSYALQDMNLIKRHPNMPFDQPESAFIMAIYVYDQHKDYQSALASTEDLLRILPEGDKRTSYQFFRGRMILKLGKKKEAMKIFQELEPKIMAMSRRDPHNVDNLDTKGELLIYLGREAEARQVWNNILRIDPQFIKKYGHASEFCKMMTR
jgi:tetratricopeptide (TPR) repeat protein